MQIDQIKKIIRSLIKYFKYKYRNIIIQYPIFFNQKIKIIIGAAETFQEGWYSTNENWLDISSKNDWHKIFKNKKLITNILSEHVFEHLSKNELEKTLQNIYEYTLETCVIRIAVPDGFNPNKEYLKNVGINGIGADAKDHKQLFNSESLTKILALAGFDSVIQEGYKKNGELILNDISSENGIVMRSRNNKSKNIILDKQWLFHDSRTSLIIDAFKK